MSLESIINRKNKIIDKLVTEFDMDMAKINKIAQIEIQALIKSGNISRDAFSAILTKAGFEDLTDKFIAKYTLLFKYSQ